MRTVEEGLAMAAPMPSDAPVTIATLSLSLLTVSFLSYCLAIELLEKLSSAVLDWEAS